MEEVKVKSVKERYLDVYKEFCDKLYGVDRDYTNTEEFKKYVACVETASKKYGEDFDVMITIKHRFGDFKLRGIDSYVKPKSMLEIVQKGVTLPDDVNSFEIVARIMVTQNGSKRFFNKKEDVVFSHRILLTDDVENKKVVEKLVGKSVDKMDKNIRAFTREDFNEFSKIIKIKPKQDELSI